MNTLIRYKLEAFDLVEALNGRLCILTPSSSKAGETVATSNSSKYCGSGFLKKESSDTYYIMVDGEKYITDSSGTVTSSYRQGYILLFGSTMTTVTRAGSTGTTTSRTSTTLRKDGKVSTTTTEVDDETILVSGTTIRDTFAINILRELLKDVKDPAALAKSEMEYYTTAAYDWAAVMMANAAKARAELDDERDPLEAEEVPVTDLEDNTQRLLNNIIVALSRTDEITPSAAEGKDPTYAERITLKDVTMAELQLAVEQYLGKTTTSTTDSDGNITETTSYEGRSAFAKDVTEILTNIWKQYSGDETQQGTSKANRDLVAALTDIKTAIEDLTAQVTDLSTETATTNTRLNTLNSTISSYASSTKSAINTAQTTADKASSKAQTALNTATLAQSDADSAYSLASSASAAASAAQEDADEAYAKAIAAANAASINATEIEELSSRVTALEGGSSS